MVRFNGLFTRGFAVVVVWWEGVQDLCCRISCWLWKPERLAKTVPATRDATSDELAKKTLVR